ncbi:uncharacterized protein LOC141529470 [Cotesia typhae]|uniref:uncharacterized protein LOC141529470 n=1 Tax=Cotesia typhae TaxID=2053667 RepID=UPI003D684B78
MPRRKVDPGFSEARSDNLPRVDAFMVATYLATNSDFVSAEMKGAKASISGRKSYGDAAIEYVQIKLQGPECTLKCLIFPEHRCHDCAASSGGCKHSIAFLMWLHRRSEEPSPTVVECYWRKSVLSQVGSAIKFIRVTDFDSETNITAVPKPFNTLQEFVNRTKQKNVQSQILKYFNSENTEKSLSIHNLLVDFINLGGTLCDNFIQFSANRMSPDLCDNIEKETQNQADCDLWFSLRYGRITASKAYEASRCNTPNGTLVELLVGGQKLSNTKAMERGKELEATVLQQVEQKLKRKFQKCGLFLSQNHPYLGTSPDAIDDEFVVEIKCPTSQKSFHTYIDTDNYNKIQFELQFKSIIIDYDSQPLSASIAAPGFQQPKYPD